MSMRNSEKKDESARKREQLRIHTQIDDNFQIATTEEEDNIDMQLKKQESEHIFKTRDHDRDEFFDQLDRLRSRPSVDSVSNKKVLSRPASSYKWFNSCKTGAIHTDADYL